MTQSNTHSGTSIVNIELENPHPAVTRYPTPVNDAPKEMSKEEKIAFIKVRFKEILEVLSLDLNDDSLQRTPERVAKMYVNEIFSGLDTNEFPDISLFENKFQHQNQSGMVATKAHFNSFCEHHLMPMIGEAYVAYIPKGNVIGLSKIPRIVRYFARRPQVQERLTMQIADSLSIILDTEDVAVTLKAQHFCVIARGIEDERSSTSTQIFKGEFATNDNLQNQYLRTIC